MLENLTSIVSVYGYLGIFLIMLLNSDFVPLFTEATLPFAGFLASQGVLYVPFIILSSVIGDLVGGVIAYLLGVFLDEKVILNLIKRYGKFVLLDERNYFRTKSLIQKHGSKIVFFAKLTPGLKTWTSVASGICKIDFKKYLIASLAASIIYNSVLVILGYQLGKNWAQIVNISNKLNLIPFFLIGVLVIYLSVKLYKKKVNKS